MSQAKYELIGTISPKPGADTLGEKFPEEYRNFASVEVRNYEKAGMRAYGVEEQKGEDGEVISINFQILPLPNKAYGLGTPADKRVWESIRNDDVREAEWRENEREDYLKERNLWKEPSQESLEIRTLKQELQLQATAMEAMREEFSAQLAQLRQESQEEKERWEDQLRQLSDQLAEDTAPDFHYHPQDTVKGRDTAGEVRNNFVLLSRPWRDDEGEWRVSVSNGGSADTPTVEEFLALQAEEVSSAPEPTPTAPPTLAERPQGRIRGWLGAFRDGLVLLNPLAAGEYMRNRNQGNHADRDDVGVGAHEDPVADAADDNPEPEPTPNIRRRVSDAWLNVQNFPLRMLSSAGDFIHRRGGRRIVTEEVEEGETPDRSERERRRGGAAIVLGAIAVGLGAAIAILEIKHGHDLSQLKDQVAGLKLREGQDQATIISQNNAINRLSETVNLDTQAIQELTKAVNTDTDSIKELANQVAALKATEAKEHLQQGVETVSQFYIDPGHGYTQEIQETFPGHSGSEYMEAYNKAISKFGKDFIEGVGKYRMSDGNWGLSRPGTSHWAPKVHSFLREYFASRP